MNLALPESYPLSAIQPNLIQAAREINELMSESVLMHDLSNVSDDDAYLMFKDLKFLVKNIDEARKAAFRDIDRMRDEFKTQIDTLILAPVNAKIDELDKQIREAERKKMLAQLEAARANNPPPVQTDTPAPRYRTTWEFDIIN